MRFSGSKAFSDAFAIFTSRFGRMAAVAVIYFVAVIAVFALLGAGLAAQIAGGMMSPEAMSGGMVGAIVLIYILVYALQFAQQAALCRICSDRHDASIGDAIATGVRCVPTLFGVVILLIIGFFVVGLVASMVMAGAAAGAQSPGLAIVLGLLMFVGFGYLGTRISMILPVVAIDEVRNPISAIATAWRISGGHVLKLFLTYVLAMIVMGAIMLALFFLTIGIPSPGAVPGMGGIIAFGVGMLVAALSIGLYFTALVVAIHRQLSGVPTETITDTFA